MTSESVNLTTRRVFLMAISISVGKNADSRLGVCDEASYKDFMHKEIRPLVTVGIPTFNRPDGLRTTLERVTQQTYSNLEIIVSDNCSVEAEKVREVVESFASDSRIRFVRQKENLGSVGNFYFLLSEGKGEYFIWAADDDEIEQEYVETLVKLHQDRPDAAIAMTGYDVVDTMEQPVIKTTLTRYLGELSSSNPFERLQKYIGQPDHFGKSRLVWGMFRTQNGQRAFERCLARIKGRAPSWSELPIETELLLMGDVAVNPKLLFHVYLLPTSDGRRGGPSKGKNMLEICERARKALVGVVEESGLNRREKQN